MQSRVFFPLAAIDQWGIDGKVELTSTEICVLAEARRYKVVEAIRVVTEVTGGEDAHKLVGKVKAKAALEELGAEILEGSMIIGDNAYDIVSGWTGVPSTSFAEFLPSPERAAARKDQTEADDAPRSDEEMLTRYLGAI